MTNTLLNLLHYATILEDFFFIFLDEKSRFIIEDDFCSVSRFSKQNEVSDESLL